MQVPSIGLSTWRQRGLALALVVALMGIAVYVAWAVTRSDTMTVTAQFGDTGGVYVGNRVTVLGVGVGKITNITAHEGYVSVTMEVPKSLALPANVHAVINAPNPVSDRTVDLSPAYASGPRLEAGAVIPMSRTNAPLQFDDILRDLNSLATTLNGTTSGSKGPLNTLVSESAALATGLGPGLRSALESTAQVLPAIAGDPGQIQKLVASLDTLTTALATHDSSLAQTLSSLHTVNNAAAADSGTLADALGGLNGALGELNAFVVKNQGNLASSLRNLATTTQALVSDQEALIKTFRVAPLGFQNFDNAIDPTAPCATGQGTICPVAFARLILGPGSAAITTAYCQSLAVDLLKLVPTLPVISSLGLPSANTNDADCIADHGLYDGHNTQTPGAPSIPDLELARYLQ